MTKLHELEISPFIRFLPFFVLTAIPLGFIAGSALGGPKGPRALVLLLLLPILGLQWWMLLTQVYRVIVHEDGAMDWVSLARAIRVRPEGVLKIAPDRSGSIGHFALTHTEGKVRFINQLNGFHEIVTMIEARNPRVELRGC